MDRITTSQAAERLGVTASRIRQFVLAGDLPAEKIGRDLFVRPEDVEKLRGRPGRGRPAMKRKKRG